MKIEASFVLAESSRPEWRKECALPPNSFPLLMLELSQDEVFVVGTFMTGFQLWNSTEDNMQVNETQFATLVKKLSWSLRHNFYSRCNMHPTTEVVKTVTFSPCPNSSC